MNLTKKFFVYFTIALLVVCNSFGNVCFVYAEEVEGVTSFSDPEYNIEFKIVASWCNSYNMSVEITNTSDETIEDWSLIFDCNDKIENIWNAEVVYTEDSVLYLTNAEWNKRIQPGETVSFGYIGTYNDEYVEPINASLLDDECVEEDIPEYTVIDIEETEYGTMYYVEGNDGAVQTHTLWDVADVVMAGASWAELLANPSWGNFAWAVLDTAAIAPLLPSSAYVRQGGKVFLNSDAVAKLAKTAKGRKAIKAALKGYRISDGISSTAIKKIRKTFNGKEATQVINLFKSAADKGLVGATNQAGVKKLSGKIKNKYTHEIKVKGKYGAYRIYGYRRANGQWVFDYFCKAHK